MALVAAVTGLSASASPRAAESHPFTIRKITGSFKRIGPNYYAAELRATTCFHSVRETDAYPNEIDVTHYSVSKSKKSRWAARFVRDRAPWLVPFGETWHGKRCGPVWIEDPIPPTHYGVESLGRACYGVRVTIVVGDRRASNRAVLTCRPSFG